MIYFLEFVEWENQFFKKFNMKNNNNLHRQFNNQQKFIKFFFYFGSNRRRKSLSFKVNLPQETASLRIEINVHFNLFSSLHNIIFYFYSQHNFNFWVQSGNLPSRKSTKENGKEIRLNVVCGALMMFHLSPSSRRTLMHSVCCVLCCFVLYWKKNRKMHKILLSFFFFAFRFTLIKFIFPSYFFLFTFFGFVEFIWFSFQLYLPIESCIKAHKTDWIFFCLFFSSFASPFNKNAWRKCPWKYMLHRYSLNLLIFFLIYFFVLL